MFGRLTLEEFADYSGASVDDVEALRSEGLLDVDGDELFDGKDLLRLQFAQAEMKQGRRISEVAEALKQSKNALVRRLFRAHTDIDPDVAAERMGLEPDQLRSLRVALGFAPQGDLDEEDLEGLSAGAGLIAAGLPWEAILEGARVYADSLQRLARANMSMTHRYLCQPLLQSGLDDHEINLRLGEAIDLLAPSSQMLVTHLLTDYMREAAIEHSISHLVPQSPDQPPGTEYATIVFADLALFSTLAELQGDEAAFELVDRTDSAIRDLLVRHEGRLVKQIGDEFMTMFADAVKAVRFSLDLEDHLSRQERHAAARIGMHSGNVLFRLGDYYGRAVNVASRIASMAMPNSILVTETIAKALADEGVRVEEIGVRSLRGMEDPIALYRVLPD